VPAYDRLACSLYYLLHGRRAARIKERCVDNAVGLDGRQRRCARQPEMQSKVDVLGGPPVTAAVQAEHRLNLTRSRETDRENGYENRSPAFSYERSPNQDSSLTLKTKTSQKLSQDSVLRLNITGQVSDTAQL